MTPLTTRMMAARTDYAARPGQNADRLVPVHRTLPAIVPVRETAPTRNPHSLSPEAPRVVHVRLSGMSASERLLVVSEHLSDASAGILRVVRFREQPTVSCLATLALATQECQI